MVFISHVEIPLNKFRWGGWAGQCPARQPANLRRKIE